MRGIFFLFFILGTYLWGNTFEIKDNFSTSSISPFFEHKITPLSYGLKDIGRDEFNKSKKSNFGYLQAAVWSKITLKNSSTDDKKLYLTNTRAGMDELDVYAIGKDGSEQHFILGDTRAQNLRPFTSRDSSCSIVLHANESIEIFIRHANFHGPVDTSWVLKSEKNFIDDRLLDTIFWGVFIGIAVALIIYNLSIYFALKRIEFLYYVAIAVSAFLFQMHSNGLMYAADIGLSLCFINDSGNITSVFGILFGVLFNYYFLNIKTNFKHLQKTYFVLIWLCFAMLLDLAIGTVYPAFIRIFEISNLILGSTVIIFISFIGVIAAYKKVPGALYYAIGQAGMFLLHIYFIVMIKAANGSLGDFVYKAPAIGTLLDVVFLALALNVRIKNDNMQLRRNENLIIFLSRFDTTGIVLNNIIHQWKLPLARIGTLVTEIEALLHLNRPIESKIKEGLPQISYNLELMKNTVKEFYEFYKNDDKPTRFYPKKEIGSIVSILKDETKEIDIKIQISIPENMTVDTFRHAFVHIFLILLHNTVKTAKSRKIKKPTVIIRSRLEKSGIFFDIQDNCGGIEPKVYGRLFESFVSTNSDSKTPTGSGLMIAKMLAEERLNGSLKASNIADGAVFTVKIGG